LQSFLNFEIKYIIPRQSNTSFNVFIRLY